MKVAVNFSSLRKEQYAFVVLVEHYKTSKKVLHTVIDTTIFYLRSKDYQRISIYFWFESWHLTCHGNILVTPSNIENTDILN